MEDKIVKEEEFKVAYFSFENLGVFSTCGEGDIIIKGITDPDVENSDCTIVLDSDDFLKCMNKWLKKSHKIYDRCGGLSCGGFVCAHICEFINEEEVKNSNEEPVYYCHVISVEMCKGKKCWKDKK